MILRVRRQDYNLVLFLSRQIDETVMLLCCRIQYLFGALVNAN